MSLISCLLFELSRFIPSPLTYTPYPILIIKSPSGRMNIGGIDLAGYLVFNLHTGHGY